MYLRLFLCAVVFSVAGWGATVTADTDDRKTSGPNRVNFQELERRDSPNDHLVCPEGFCKSATPDRVSPDFPIPAKVLKARVDALLSTAPRTEIVSAGETHVVAEQRSLIFRFPDTVDIEVVPLGPDASAVAVYSRSRYGYYDFGANKRRVEEWLAQLAAPPS